MDIMKEDLAVRRYRDDLISPANIARELNVSISTVYLALRKNNVRWHPHSVWLTTEWREKNSRSHMGHPVCEKVMERMRQVGPMAIGWKGGEGKDERGRNRIYTGPGRKNNRRKLSRVLMEKKLGRPLTRTEVVHHINGIKNDDRIENLTLFGNNAEHMKWHHDQLRADGVRGFQNKPKLSSNDHP
jgi:IS30 family transposase